MSGTATSHHLATPRMWLSYLGVGVAATAAHWALMAWLVERWAAQAWWASGAGAVLGAQVAFVSNRRFTFGHRGPVWPAWWRFTATAALGGAMGMVIVAAGVMLGWHYLLAQALATAVAVVLTFAVNRAWTFGPLRAGTP
jgi:putative flippase GtrA